MRSAVGSERSPGDWIVAAGRMVGRALCWDEVGGEVPARSGSAVVRREPVLGGVANYCRQGLCSFWREQPAAESDDAPLLPPPS